MESKEEAAKELCLETPWGRMAAKAYGSPLDIGVLMVHGLMDNAGSFDRLIPYLPKNFYYVCIDLPGHGYSSHFGPGIPLKFFDFVHSLGHALNALKWDTCYAIGHSFGAQILFYYNLLYPGKIRKMILLDGISSEPIEDYELTPYFHRMYNLKAYSTERKTFFTKEEVMYALRYKRNCVLTTEAAEAMFVRSVTKVGDLYKYNHDPRLKFFPTPSLNLKQYYALFSNFSTPTIMILPTNGFLSTRRISKFLERQVRDPKLFTTRFVHGNHNAHNNSPEIVAPHVSAYISNDLHSKL